MAAKVIATEERVRIGSPATLPLPKVNRRFRSSLSDFGFRDGRNEFIFRGCLRTLAITRCVLANSRSCKQAGGSLGWELSRASLADLRCEEETHFRWVSGHAVDVCLFLLSGMRCFLCIFRISVGLPLLDGCGRLRLCGYGHARNDHDPSGC